MKSPRLGFVLLGLILAGLVVWIVFAVLFYFVWMAQHQFHG